MKKTALIGIANDTLQIIQNGFYINQQQEKIDISTAQKKAIDNSIHYKEDEFEAMFTKRNQLFATQTDFDTHFEVIEASTLGFCSHLSKTKNKIFCLNFASAKHEGGGFLGGAQAQEESLARSSSLYPCLTKFHYQFYEMHKSLKNSYYTSDMIFSPFVPIFKDDNGNLLDNFYEISFLTSPAVNVGALRWHFALAQTKRGIYNEEKYKRIMTERIERILTIAYLNDYQEIVLGAWGCGAFHNDPREVAQLFADLLLDNQAIFKNKFKNIYFAIYAAHKNDKNIDFFKNIFENSTK
ncbi:MAG: TIGR02452 family protein [Cytophagales bacterium]|nr:MAG: TIGR02452 family protein [Cytophagales bacterium]